MCPFGLSQGQLTFQVLRDETDKNVLEMPMTLELAISDRMIKAMRWLCSSKNTNGAAEMPNVNSGVAVGKKAMNAMSPTLMTMPAIKATRMAIL